jgi:hypothetical protein
VAQWLGIIIVSAFAIDTAWDWMIARGRELVRFPAPALDPAFAATAINAVLAALMLAGGVWLVHGSLGCWLAPGTPGRASEWR